MSNLSEVKPLLEFLSNHKYKNLHTRKTKQVKKEKVLKHLHGVKLTDINIISGYFCGLLTNSKLSEIEYEIDHKGTVEVISAIGITKREALEYIDDEKNIVMTRASADQKPVKWSPKYKKNNFYLRRSSKKIVTPAAKKSVSNGILSSKFVETMAEWNLSIIEGQK